MIEKNRRLLAIVFFLQASLGYADILSDSERQKKVFCPVSEGYISDAMLSELQRDCFVSIKEIKDLSSYQIVDTRKEEDYQRYFIPGSLNVNTRHLEVLEHLKNKKILLLDEGFSVFTALTSCKQLKDKGFTDVQYLQGGIHTLTLEQSPMVYTADYVFQAPTVSIRSYIDEINYGKVTTLTLEQEMRDFLIDGNVSNTYWLDKEDTSWLHVKKTLVKLNQSTPNQALVVTGGRDDIAQLQRKFRSDPIANVFFLAEGYTQTQSYIRQNRMMLLAKGRETEALLCKKI